MPQWGRGGSVRYGSLFSGAGGLDLAIEEVFGATCAWHCEVEPAAAAVLACRWPGVPNLGDVTAVDWYGLRGSVELLCGGYPCQPFSISGQQKGADDDRHLWPYFAEAVRAIRPTAVVLENVANHRRIGFGDVLGDLAAIGYDASWTSLRASDVGAVHERERVFVLAWPGDEAPPHATSERRDPRTRLRAGNAGEVGGLFPSDSAGDPAYPWGPYAPGIEHWATVVGGVAPRPVVKGPGGGAIPSPRFIEWMVGWPTGWASDIDGLTYEDVIRLAGNGVVPQQAVAALRHLLTFVACEVAA